MTSRKYLIRLKKHLPSVEDQKTLGGQVLHRPNKFGLADEVKNIFEQLPLKKPTIEELFRKFGIILVAKNNLFLEPIGFWIFVNLNLHWLCGAHQKLALIWWLFQQQYYYHKY